MDIPINAEVRCADGPCGRTTRVIINPALREVTHLVVREKDFLRVERIVPIDLVLESTPRWSRSSNMSTSGAMRPTSATHARDT